MKVSDDVKREYQNNGIHKNLILRFPEINLQIEHQYIHKESMYLRETLLEKENIEFVGCIASIFKIKVENISEDIKGKKLVAKIYTDGTEEEPVTLFNGIVDSALKQSNKQIKEITAYDELYTKGNIDVAAWYHSLSFPISLKDVRDSLFSYIGLEQEETELPNDRVVIKKQYHPKSLQALSVIKAVCQINGAFGIINREGRFEYRILAQSIQKIPYPALTLFPSSGLFPANPTVALAEAQRYADSVEAESFSFYKKVDYEEFTVKPVDKLTIRQSEEDAGITYGSGTNNYIIQGNMFTYGLTETVLKEMAKAIYENVQGFSYYPFTSDNNGLPFLECGLDAVSYVMIDYETSYAAKESRTGSREPVYRQQEFYVLSRELTGIQALRDAYGAKGEEYQSEFITDLQTQIDVIKKNVKQEVKEALDDYDFTDKFADYTYDKDYLDSRLDGQLKVESVSALPTNPDENTIYLIQGKVTVT